jgi:DNA modification methylase
LFVSTGTLKLEKVPLLYGTGANGKSVFFDVKRVLRDDGTCWVNVGDSYNAGTDAKRKASPRTDVGRHHDTTDTGNKRTKCSGLKTKDLVGIPWRVAFAMQADGWYLRQDIIWHKPNPMPESVTDRCTKAHEYVFLLTKSARYHYDADAIKEDCTQDEFRPTFRGGAYVNNATFDNSDGGKSTVVGNVHRKPAGWDTGSGAHGTIHRSGRAPVVEYSEIKSTKRNRRSVWTVATAPYSGAHFATFPPGLIKPMIAAGCPEGGTVLDPFAGSGTTLAVARELGCKSIGIEANAEYCKLAKGRISVVTPSIFAGNSKSEAEERAKTKKKKVTS